MEHLTSLLAASDMSIVLAVLNLLYVFAKRSNYITRLPGDKKQLLLGRLTHLAESWGGKENGFGLAQCCRVKEAGGGRAHLREMCDFRKRAGGFVMMEFVFLER